MDRNHIKTSGIFLFGAEKNINCSSRGGREIMHVPAGWKRGIIIQKKDLLYQLQRKIDWYNKGGSIALRERNDARLKGGGRGRKARSRTLGGRSVLASEGKNW